VKSFSTGELYDPEILRTIFIEFDSPNWEKEMAAFKNTDVELPAKVTVDGKNYADVGIHFRGQSSFMMVGEGRKRSLNSSFDFLNEKQNLYGYRTLELLNSHDDPSFVRTVLSYQIAREYVPAPKANFVRVVINGESWGVYINKQAFNKEFAKDWFGTTKGARWKAPGSPRGRASLAYLGDDPDEYKSIYEIKSKDDAKSWKDLIQLCKVLNETPADKLEETLSPILDIDGALRFLALENALINNDGYWVRSSDYSIYQDTKGKFHILPHDSNETFARPGGPGFGGPRGGNPGEANNGVKLDPLRAANDESKPLISKLLAVPNLRAKYLGYVREIADKWLDWEKLWPIATKYQALIAADMKADTHKLNSFEAFEKSLLEDIAGRGPGPMGRGTIGLKTFADQRREYLLGYQ
jgi:spore coat protein CotH